MNRSGFRNSLRRTLDGLRPSSPGRLRSSGVTLVELLVVVAIIGILAIALGSTIFRGYTSESSVRSAARELVADLQLVQNDAAAWGGGTIVNGVLIRRSVYIVFNTATNSYSVWRYQDTNGNNVRDAGEAIPAPTIPAAKILPNNVAFGLTYKKTDGSTATVDKGACTNGSAPGSPVSFGVQVNTPCNNNNCFEMSSKGFPPFSGSLYLSNDDAAFAVNINAAGLLRICRWSVEEVQWVDAY